MRTVAAEGEGACGTSAKRLDLRTEPGSSATGGNEPPYAAGRIKGADSEV